MWSMAPADPNPHAGYLVLHLLSPVLLTPTPLTARAAGRPILRVETSPHAKIRMGWGWRGLGGCWGGGGRVGWGGGVLQLEDIMSTSHPRWKRRRWEKKWEEPRKEDTTSRFPQMLFIREEEEEEAPLLLLLLPFTPSPMLIIRCTCLKTELCWIQPPPLFYDVHWLNTDFYKCFPFIITVSAWWLHCSRSWSNPPRTRRRGRGAGGSSAVI